MKSAAPLDIDPPSAERVWFTHTMTGERGYLAKRGGKDVIRLDRPMDPHATRPMGPDWQRDEGWRPITVNQRAQVAYAADLALCRALGNHAGAKKAWIDLPDSERITFIESGPSEEDGPRHKLWLHVMVALEDLAR